MTDTQASTCLHCGGTTFCGGAADASEPPNQRPACATCKVKSGLNPQQEFRGVVCSVCGGAGRLLTQREGGNEEAGEQGHAPEVEEEQDAPADNRVTVVATLVLLAVFWAVVCFLTQRPFTGASVAVLVCGLAWSGGGGVLGARLFDKKGLHPAFGCLGGGIVGPLLVWSFLAIPSAEKHPRFWALANRVGLVAGVVGCVVGVVVLVLALTSIPGMEAFRRAGGENRERLESRKAEGEAKAKALQEQSGMTSQPVAPPQRKTYTRDDFRNLVRDKTKDQIIKLIGPPDLTQQIADLEMWYYRGITVDPLSGRADAQVQLSFQGGYLARVSFY